MLKDDFEREVRAEALKYDGPKDDPYDGYKFWQDLVKVERRPELLECRCTPCRRQGNSWEHAKSVLRRCGFSQSAT